MLQVYEQLAGNDDWFTPPDMAAAVVELLHNFQPKSLLSLLNFNVDEADSERCGQWQPSQAQGLAICRAMHAFSANIANDFRPAYPGSLVPAFEKAKLYARLKASLDDFATNQGFAPHEKSCFRLKQA